MTDNNNETVGLALFQCFLVISLKSLIAISEKTMCIDISINWKDHVY